MAYFSRRGRILAASLLAAFVGFVLVAEALGWPFLVAPMERWLADTLNRPVRFAETGYETRSLKLRLLGRIRIEAGIIEIGQPDWSDAPAMMEARDAALEFGYVDLWRMRQGDPLRVRELSAERLDLRLQRAQDGRSSWQFGRPRPPDEEKRRPFAFPTFDQLRVVAGSAELHDAMRQLELSMRFTLSESTATAAVEPDGIQPAERRTPAGLNARGEGSYRGRPVRFELQAGGLAAWLNRANEQGVPARLTLRAGSSDFVFQGTVENVHALKGAAGRYTLSGPSLSAVGDALGLTLPTTPPFRMSGRLRHRHPLWWVVVEKAHIGDSNLSGAFRYHAADGGRRLEGELSGRALALSDLAPAVGAPAQAPGPGGRTGRRLLPDRKFNLPALKAMDANIVIAIDRLVLGDAFAAPMEPFRTHLVLRDGVLTLQNIEARTAKGQLSGLMRLDSTAKTAKFQADLRLANVQLEDWLQHDRRKPDKAPPVITGRLLARVRLAGQGASTAEILGSSAGSVEAELRDAKLSAYTVELAGIDLAEALGMAVTGDSMLPINCGIAHLEAKGGVLRPKLAVLDTADSAIWIDGAVSLGTEQLDLRAVVTPKDFSPLTLRTPLQIRGTLRDPDISLDKGPLGRKVAAAALLSLVNPIAALVPFLDAGDSEKGQDAAAGCRELAARATQSKGKPARR